MMKRKAAHIIRPLPVSPEAAAWRQEMREARAQWECAQNGFAWAEGTAIEACIREEAASRARYRALLRRIRNAEKGAVS